MNGDTESAMFAIMSYIYTSFQSGRSLPSIETDCRVYLTQMEDLKREKARRQTKTIFQTVLNMMGKFDSSSQNNDPCVLTGEAMDEEIMTQTATAENDKVVLAMIQAFRMQLLSTFGRYEQGAEFAISVGNRLADQIPCSTMVAVDPFFRALSLYSMAHKRTKQFRRYRHHANLARSFIKSYVRKGNPNVRHLESFLDAKKAALNPRTYHVAMKQYEIATVMASRGGFQHDSALANEHFGEFLLEEMKDEEMAAFRIHKAIQLYYEWGSSLKASMLEQKHEELLFNFPDARFD
mmetsp:Transcript_25011/g.46652  ORF Transcript_25011/g.46652 Transcript_25011/m.46652 type:complete len:293 (+) Transcript_25011:1355-2233(+)|eukprot:CAMPEP_0178740566 /NCGR_PEP_ID=MMETSP0744-20121128/4659_1 /TAXON_ID=913974 /ORGANISM="Nitzschia punctata, Strain CCMP561" /LENGTH=292 /DNA_ID=CAMNT_0020393349 /DNA_START=1237 /DNA_END=2115 /DNA_ORIENTATION=-